MLTNEVCSVIVALLFQEHPTSCYTRFVEVVEVQHQDGSPVLGVAVVVVVVVRVVKANIDDALA